jgi:hypothetical protein
MVAKIVLLRCTSWMPQPDSLGIHQRSLWSVEYDAALAGATRTARRERDRSEQTANCFHVALPE